MSRARSQLYLILNVAGVLVAVAALLLGHWWFWLLIGAGFAAIAWVNIALSRDRKAKDQEKAS